MRWEYRQSTGNLKFNGIQVATGYAGYGSGKNNPNMEAVKDIGPIPKVKYGIEAPRTSARTGPYVLPLIPIGHNALGRTDFQIHGDSKSNRGNASNDCIIMDRSIRESIWNSHVRRLVVVQ